MAKDGHRHANCFVAGCVDQHSSLFLLPSAERLRTRWLDFVFAGCEPGQVPRRLYVCARHFTEDCFENMGPYRAGFAQRLRINHQAVPSLRDPSSKGSASGPFMRSPARRDAACQTDPAQTRTAGTQLSLRTLQPRFRSEGVQAAVSCRDCGVGTSPGDRSTGNRSTGDRSTGNQSTADRSTADRSTGDRSTGDQSTGDQSTGDRSTGDQFPTNRSVVVKRRSKRARLDQGQDPEQEPSEDCSSTASEESTSNLQVSLLT